MLFLLIFSVIPNAVGVPAENNLQRIGDARGNNLPNIVARTKDGKFYLLQSTQGDMDWMKAEMQCLGYGDHLTSIHSDEENLEVGELCKVAAKGVKNLCWIGGFFDAKRAFYWNDRSKTNYTEWNPGEPNNDGNEFCVELDSNGDPGPFFKWNDIPCNVAVAYAVCRKTGL